MYIIVMYVIMRIDSVIFIPYLFLIAERCVSAMEKKSPCEGCTVSTAAPTPLRQADLSAMGEVVGVRAIAGGRR